MDNGPELAGQVLDACAYQRGVKLRFVEPGKPVRNALVESFNGKFRDEWLNERGMILMNRQKEVAPLTLTAMLCVIFAGLACLGRFQSCFANQPTRLLAGKESFATTLPSPEEERSRQTLVFRIGKQDHSFMEFAHHEIGAFGGSVGSIPTVVYRVGQSSPAKDWPAYQPGSFDSQVRGSTREQDWVFQKPSGIGAIPFSVVFNLGTPPRGKFVLHVDAIFRYERPAAPRYVVDVNGHVGSYRLNPKPAPKLWWPTGSGNLQFVGYETLDMPLPALYFHVGSNTITFRCEGGFGIYYDDLALFNKPRAQVLRIIDAAVQPTVLYKWQDKHLVELVRIRLRSARPMGKGRLRLVLGSEEMSKGFDQRQFGDTTTIMEVQPPERALPVLLYVSGERRPIFTGIFRSKRHWLIYARPAEQADFGFDEVPALTLDWENRYLDKALRITQQFPSYSFTLDASANLEAYLKTRDKAHREQLLDYLRSGKFGLNALYEDFLTGLATPEELFHLVDYAHNAGLEYGFKIDSASQTDEPTVCWAVPQVLAEAGIRYYADGSDDFRGTFNPRGLWNFRSPFYWEAPNGTKVLVWSGVGYVVVNDLTWGGWNPEAVLTGRYSPSLLGLERSLPLFLSQYERTDYPFDSVLLYGLHNDEIPIRHYGSADVFKLWNETYAYPKLIPGTLDDYFRYVMKNFGTQIKTYRGSTGANWEEMAAQDSRVVAKNRASQMQILAAEKLESVATWLEPFLRFDESGFHRAWKSIMLTDDFVLSDMASMSRPYSYLTRYEEDVHRGNAVAAYRQTRDLLRVAMDHISGLIETRKPGVVVFNTGSQPRDGVFDFELDPDEALLDPSAKQLLPCGILKKYKGYNDVRCWARGVPSLGYHFYPIVKGSLEGGRSVSLGSPTDPIEGRYYTLQLDPRTGAVAHLIDKKTGIDLVNTHSGWDLNEYLYVTGGDPSSYYQGLADAGSDIDNRLLGSVPTLPRPELTIHQPNMIGRPQVQRFPWGTVVTVQSRAFNTPEITSTLTLYDKQKLVGFRDDVEKTATLKQEGVYFAFPFAVTNPRVEYQEATSWVNPQMDLLPGANREWFCTQGGVRLAGTDRSIGWVSIDAPLITLEDINRGLWLDSIRIHNGTLFSYVMNNYTVMDAPVYQGGHFTFRYVLTSGSNSLFSRMAAFSTTARSPLYAIRHYYDKGWRPRLPEDGMGFLQVSPSAVEVLTIHPARKREHTYLVRVHNTSDHRLTARLEFPSLGIKDAYLGSPWGKKTGSVVWSGREVEFPMARDDIQTLAVVMRAQVRR